MQLKDQKQNITHNTRTHSELMFIEGTQQSRKLCGSVPTSHAARNITCKCGELQTHVAAKSKIKYGPLEELCYHFVRRCSITDTIQHSIHIRHTNITSTGKTDNICRPLHHSINPSTINRKLNINSYLYDIYTWTQTNILIFNADTIICTLFTPDCTHLVLQINTTALHMSINPNILGLTFGYNSHTIIQITQ